MTQPDHADDARLVAETLGAGWHCHAGNRPFRRATIFLAPPGTGEAAQPLDPADPAWRALVTLARQHAAWKDGHLEYHARVRELAAKATRALGDLAQ